MSTGGNIVRVDVAGSSEIGRAVKLIQAKCNVGPAAAYTILLRTALESQTNVHETAAGLTGGPRGRFLFKRTR